MTLTLEKLDEIEKGCEGVTPGPWIAFHNEPSQRYYGRAVWTVSEQGRPTDFVGAMSKEVHAHIARLDPSTVLELVRLARLAMTNKIDKGE